MQQFEEAAALTYRPFGAGRAGVQLRRLCAVGSDYKMALIQTALAGTSCTWRSPTHCVPMSMCDLVVREPALRRNGAGITAYIVVARRWQRERREDALSADQQSQRSRERTSLFGGLSAAVLTNLDAERPPKLPLGCATTQQLAAKEPGWETRQAMGHALVCVTPLHALKKNLSKAFYDAALDCAGTTVIKSKDGVVLSATGRKGEAQASIKVREAGTRTHAPALAPTPSHDPFAPPAISGEGQGRVEQESL